MVTQEIVLGHIVSVEGIQVDSAKIDLISNLLVPETVKEVKLFLGHTGFYRRLIRDFRAISRPLRNLLVKDVPFKWTSTCQEYFDKLK